MDILVYIEKNLDGELSLDSLAQRAGFSPYHFHRLFGDLVGENLKAYIRRLRLERSAFRLRISQASVLDLALQAGYRTHESFTRAFSRQFGINPSEFRAQYQARRNYTALRRPGASDSSGSEGKGQPKLDMELMQPIHLVFIRHNGPYESVLPQGAPFGSAWDELFRWAEAQGIDHQRSLLMGIAHDDPNITPADKIRFDVCMQVPYGYAPQGKIGYTTIQPGWYAFAKHTAPFEQLGDTYQTLAESVLMSKQYRLRMAPPLEFYNHTRVNEQIELHHTQVYLAVEPVTS